MELAGKTIFAFCMIVMPFMVYGDSCLDPKVKSSVYTTTEATSSMDTIFIVQFSLTCKNGLKDLTLFADVNGRTLAVTRSEDNTEFQYQVSFSDENKNLPSGKYDLKFYDEDGYSNLRKAQRSGENVGSVKSLFTIPVNHPGVWKGQLVPSEFVALAVSAAVFYFAYSTRAQLQSS
ncbi:translocon-associated protein subunit delta-like [Ruditapes philippinarum]|uniref:translocon-associated protein subunit delta-like n=1 Tax=Ruditapes philippinarum TaxID=129788 RepID=UPI00295B3C92|nr:translocon-associated protein subunit delta-like [Ruditapes philippinarum]